MWEADIVPGRGAACQCGLTLKVYELDLKSPYNEGQENSRPSEMEEMGTEHTTTAKSMTGMPAGTLHWRAGSQHGDLKPKAVGALGLHQMPPTAFFCAWKYGITVYGNLRIIEV